MKTCITKQRAISLAAIFVLSASVAHYGISESLRRLRQPEYLSTSNNIQGDAKSIPESPQEIDQQQFQVSINSNHININSNQRRTRGRKRRRLQEDETAIITETNSLNEKREKYFGRVFPQPEKMPLHLKNTMQPLDANDLVFFWHIPKTAGQLMKVIMGSCFGLRRAEKLKDPASMEFVKDIIVNVDTQTLPGIEEAYSFQLADSGMADVISSSHFLSTTALFTSTHRGRAFTIMRHPVDTAAALFFARKQIRPDLRTITLAQYTNQEYYPDNWMVRQLSATLPGEELTEFHLDRAKNVLSAKFFVGISEQLGETLRQLRLYYKWTPLEGKELCAHQMINGGNSNFVETKRPTPARGSDDWRTVAKREKWDMELYYLGLEMFSRQGMMFK